MLFNSFAFLLFFPVVCVIYFLLPTVKWRNYFLLAASYYFYMNWEPVYALLLLTSTAITYAAAIMLDKSTQRRKLILTAGIVLNLAILFFFKYYNFAAENITALLDYFHLDIPIPNLSVLLPVGISFYIFQALGYMIDVYRGDIRPEKNFFTYALFVSFFPQLVAGPIERSTNLLKQFYRDHKFEADRAITGVTLMLWGYFLKLVIADRCALYVDSVYNNLPHHSGGSILLASILFCFQLYGDFAGYSYIAIGASNVMGFKLMDNFRRPYFFSESVQEFWKRNHISLTSWFMDYIYYPLVGSSTRLLWWCLAIFITFFISGFWHGAAWTYVLCFSIFGFYLVVCSLKDKWQRRFEKRHGLKKKEWWLWLNRFVTFLLVTFALIYFRANNLGDAFFASTKILTNGATMPFSNMVLLYCLIGIALLFAVEFVIEYRKVRISEENMLKVYTLSSAALLVLILHLGVFSGSQFIYFQF
ncbi:MAG: MBOAT family protein [Muribaculaceae bacterium]|nr:MBOAT family protein [Muribaculaceae bacterium]